MRDRKLMFVLILVIWMLHIITLATFEQNFIPYHKLKTNENGKFIIQHHHTETRNNNTGNWHKRHWYNTSERKTHISMDNISQDISSNNKEQVSGKHDIIYEKNKLNVTDAISKYHSKRHRHQHYQYNNNDNNLNWDSVNSFASNRYSSKMFIDNDQIGSNIDYYNDDDTLLHWPVKKVAIMEGDLILGGLMMVHSREDTMMCGSIMPQGGIQALEAMLYTLDQINKVSLLPNITIGAHILDDCDRDSYGLEMAVDFIKGRCLICIS